MRLFASFTRKDPTENYSLVELYYSALRPGDKWFCRIWHPNWIDMIYKGKKEYGEAYGASKFEAYRKAMSDLKQPGGCKYTTSFKTA